MAGLSKPTIQRLPIFMTGTPIWPVFLAMSRAASGSRSTFTEFTSYYAAVQGGSAGWQPRVGGGVPVGGSRILGMLIV
jgi:hypothetical protein